MSLFKRKMKNKKRKYKFKLSDYEALKLTDALTEAILMVYRDIESIDTLEDFDAAVLYDLLSTKYALMTVMKSFGSNLYQSELENKKPIEKEIEKIREKLEEKKESSFVDIKTNEDINVATSTKEEKLCL